MTERNSELAKQLLEDQNFIEALAAKVGIAWGLGENPGWFFGQLVKKVRAFQQRGAKADATVVPMVFASPEAKEIHSRKNDLRSLRHAHANASEFGRVAQAAGLWERIQEIEARIIELGGDPNAP
jgi:hypothetical protein